MKRSGMLVTIAVIGVAIIASVGTFGAAVACNTGNGTCPDKAAIVPGASCSDEHLQCAFDLPTPAVACDGMSTVIATSCTCTDRQWSCPSAFECEAGTDGGQIVDEASTDGGGGA
jgi:hypothetical protein